MTFPPVIIGMLVSAAAYAFFTGYDTTIKYLSEGFPIFMAMFIAFLVAIASVYAHAKITLKDKLKDEMKIHSWKLHAGRAATISISQLMYFSAIPHIPLTEFYIILFIIPILVALLAVPFLQEKLTGVLVMALVVSFAGILLALLPQQGDGAGFGVWHLLVFVASVINANSHIFLRKMMGRGESRTASALTSLCALALATGCMALFELKIPDIGTLLLIIVAGIFYALASICLPIAFKLAPASLAAPPAFLQLIYGAIAGYLVFNFVPPIWTYLGGGVVILANLYLLHCQHNAEKENVLKDV